MVNYVAVLVAALASMVIGMIWYSPVAFGNMWMKLAGISKKEAEKKKKQGMAKEMVAGYLSNAVMAYVLSMFITLAAVEGMMGGMEIAFWLWLGFVATVTLGGVLWKGEPLQLYLLNNGYNLVGLLVMGAILGVW